MYAYLSSDMKKDIPQLQFGDNLMGTIVKDYYQDNSFCRTADGDISLWNLYNLFTGANKASYIDTFFDRSLNAFEFVGNIARAIEHKSQSWFLQ